METAMELKQGYKESKIGIIPVHWSINEIGNLAKIQTGNKDTQDKIEGGKYPFFVRSQTIVRINSFSFEGEAVLTSGDGVGVGKIYHYLNEKFDYHQRVYNIHSFREGILGKYFFHYFSQHFYKRVIRLSAKNSVDSVRMDMISKMLIPIPPISEQQKIAEILSTWDKGIQNTQSLVEQLKLRKKGLMQQLLTGKKRLSEFSEEWNELKLGTFFNERKETGFNDLPLLSVGRNGVYPQDDSNKKDSSNSDKSKYKRIYIGDIGYNTMRMWQGRSALSKMEGIVSPAYTILKPRENADTTFFSYLFKLEDTIHKFYRNSQGMVSDTWMCKFKDFAIIHFQAPPTLEEQKAIANILTSCDKEIKLQQAKLKSLQSQKKGLTQKLLTGKTRVTID